MGEFGQRADERRSFDRFVNFTDAIVAIAITLMVLPLLSIPGPRENQTVWEVLADNSGALFAFGLAFALIAQNWLVHNRVVNAMRSYDGRVYWLNIGWVASIALMPWSAAMFGSAQAFEEGGEGFGGTGLVFFGLLAVISAFMLAISVYVDHHRELLDPDGVKAWTANRLAGLLRSIIVITCLVAIGVLTVVIPQVAAYLPIIVIPLGMMLAARMAQRLAPR